MKNLLILTLIFSFSFSFAQSNTENEVKTVIRDMFEDAFSKTDEKAVDKYFSDNIVIFEDGVIYDKDGIRSMVGDIKKSFEKEAENGHTITRVNDFEFMKVFDNGNSAFVYYLNSADFLFNGTSIAKMSWLESARLEKIDEHWKIVFLHSTKINDEQ